MNHRHLTRRRGWLAILAAMLVLIPLMAEDGENLIPSGEKWTVRLLAPLSTNFNRKGDMVSASVIEPPAYQGAILEGVIRDLKAGGESAKASSIQFDFVTLHAGDKTIHVGGALLGTRNSRGEPGIDEEGSALESAASGITGRLVGVFSRSASTTPRLSSKSARLVFATGSEFVVQLQPRKGSNAH